MTVPAHLAGRDVAETLQELEWLLGEQYSSGLDGLGGDEVAPARGRVGSGVNGLGRNEGRHVLI